MANNGFNHELYDVQNLLSKNEWGEAILLLRVGIKRKSFKDAAMAYQVLGDTYLRVNCNSWASDAFAQARECQRLKRLTA